MHKSGKKSIQLRVIIIKKESRVSMRRARRASCSNSREAHKHAPSKLQISGLTLQ